jgi:hypothetical protein
MNERRVDLGLRWTDVAEAGDVSPETLRAVRRNSAPLRDLTKAGIERGLRWSRGSVDRILAGGDPSPALSSANGDQAALERIASDPDLSDGMKRALLAAAAEMASRTGRRSAG